MQNRLLAIVVAIVLAIVAAMALVIYANSADRRAINEQAPVQVWVAAQEIKQGESLDAAFRAAKFRPADYPRRLVAKDAVRSLNQLSGRVAAVDIMQGELLLESRWVNQEEIEGQNLLTIKAGHQAVSIQVDATRQVSGLVSVNNRVNVYVTISQADGVKSKLLLPNLKVLAVGTTTIQQGTGTGQQANRNGNLSTLTLEVRDRDVPRVVFAAENGRIYLTLVPPGGTAPPPGEARNVGNLFN
ncbi:MAG TPA: Flp pilus assembly protein CpaB [Actinomycetes bacterium]|jgi:pilus assembly protein CpaB|nr:Flp pilus assembly protein CpaB [Actinomycetes bacterium]